VLPLDGMQEVRVRINVAPQVRSEIRKAGLRVQQQSTATVTASAAVRLSGLGTFLACGWRQGPRCQVLSWRRRAGQLEGFPVLWSCGSCLTSLPGRAGAAVPRLALAAGAGGQQGLSSGRRLGRGVWSGRHGPGARRGSARRRLEPAARARRQCAPGTGTLAAGVRFRCAAAHLGAEHARRPARPGSWCRGRQAADGRPSDGSGVQAVIGGCGRPD
jgi:hypothetical protein